MKTSSVWHSFVFQDVFKTCLQDIFLKTPLPGVFLKTPWRHPEGVLKTCLEDSWRRPGRWNFVMLKTSSRRLGKKEMFAGMRLATENAPFLRQQLTLGTSSPGKKLNKKSYFASNFVNNSFGFLYNIVPTNTVNIPQQWSSFDIPGLFCFALCQLILLSSSQMVNP